ncbi:MULTISPECIES: phosphatase PAP2 family protein [Streptomyces]|uniref:Phosphatase PAP2 family protein n=1 Tax=Streptomyces dengpaensis TaxID=2049881 RepID=A0ABN5IDC3_9ACTN|nr:MULTISPECIES: phosphatase PAP2 family protein [Streptomyces]AVH61204.1 phosphatase PAP2 family protein [Streptomyces dengpaensis]
MDGLDRRLLSALHACGRDPRVAAVARALSWTGEHGALWLAAGLAGAAVDRERRGAWLRATALTATAHLASMGVKRIVRRPRPPHVMPLVSTAGRHSFPSSHASSAAAAAIAYGALGARSAFVGRPLGARGAPIGPPLDARSSPVAPPLAAALCASVTPLAAAMCVSRMVVGVHYPSDVAAGAVLGALTARLGARWIGDGHA